MDTVAIPMDEWNTWSEIDWKTVECAVFKLQKRIYRASQSGKVRLVHRLQRLLVKSYYGRLLAVRKVTQDNQGKKTAGVDGIKSVPRAQRLEMAKNLKLNGNAKPARRVWIPKPNGEKRPLGIPIMYDRALQALVKQAMEPQWEALFEPNSYGFRPGRGCHDAIEAIFSAIRYKAKYALDADIAKCFDKIDHQALLDKAEAYPTLRRQLKAWLKCGAMDGKELFPTAEGTPQGGVISPLLANIALHGMEGIAKTVAKKMKQTDRSISLVRYADDFVVLHESLEVVKECKGAIQEWLKGIGLELQPAKTRLTHTLNAQDSENPGFNFLGFNVRQYKVGRHQSGKNTHGETLGFKTLIKPAKEKVKAHVAKIGAAIKTRKCATQAAVVATLNPIIRGWVNYYSTSVSKETYSDLDSSTFRQLWAWAKRRHPNKSRKWVANKYWKTVGTRNWAFTDEKGTLTLHSDAKVVRHVKVQGTRSPYDGDETYWGARLGKHPEVPAAVARLLKAQKGKCKHCGLDFRHGDKWEIDHIIPKSQGGKDTRENRQLLHKHCHDTKTAKDIKTGTQDKRSVAEEPDEAKVSRPVLKTSLTREGQA